MTRGNQRDSDRAKAAKKTAAANKGKRDDGLTVTQRRERDAQAIRDKQAKKDSAKAGEGGK